MNAHGQQNPATFEVSFLRAMQLLHKPGKEATDQIKSMLDDCLAQRRTSNPATAAQKLAYNSVGPKPQPPTRSAPTPRPAPPPPAADLDCAALSCVVCRRPSQAPGNQIVECQECRSLYHQDCHRPSLASEDVRDPRLVWYCAGCTSRRKRAKLCPKPAVILLPSGPSARDRDREGAGPPQPPEMSPFKSWQFGKR